MFTKFASFGVTSSVLVPVNATAAQGLAMVKQAHRATFEHEVRPGFLYIRSRAISSRCNDNFDEFPAEEIKKAYKTFIGKPVFVNHHNENHRRARGVIIDAVLHEDTGPDGRPDTWSEVLMEVDAIQFPKLADAIQKGHIDRTSMGTDVQYSICSACGNKATSPAEYCAHIPRQKGQRLYKADPKTGSKEGILIREICYGLSFFENSLLVEEPADPTAFFTGVDASGLNKAASKTAHLDHEDFQMGPSKPGQEPTSHAHIPMSDEDREFYRQMIQQRNQDLELSEQAEKRVVNTKDHIDLMQHMIEAHDRYPEDHDFARKSPINTDALGESDEDMDRDLTHAEMQKVHDHEHNEYPEDFPTATTLDGSHFHTASKTAADNPVFLAPNSPTPDGDRDLSDEEWKQQNENQWSPNIVGRARAEWRKKIKGALNQHGVPYERFLKKTKDIHGWNNELRLLHHYGTMLREDPDSFHDVAESIANLSNNKKTSSKTAGMNPRTAAFVQRVQANLSKVAELSDDEIHRNLNLPAAGEPEDKGKELGRALWNAVVKGRGFDSEEEMDLHDKNKIMTDLQSRYGHGKPGGHYNFFDGEDPYYEIKHPSGWSIRDYGGPLLDIHHAAEPHNAQDRIDLTNREGTFESPTGHNKLKSEFDDWRSEWSKDYEGHIRGMDKWRQRNQTQASVVDFFHQATDNDLFQFFAEGVDPFLRVKATAETELNKAVSKHDAVIQEAERPLESARKDARLEWEASYEKWCQAKREAQEKLDPHDAVRKESRYKADDEFSPHEDRIKSKINEAYAQFKPHEKAHENKINDLRNEYYTEENKHRSRLRDAHDEYAPHAEKLRNSSDVNYEAAHEEHDPHREVFEQAKAKADKDFNDFSVKHNKAVDDANAELEPHKKVYDAHHEALSAELKPHEVRRDAAKAAAEDVFAPHRQEYKRAEQAADDALDEARGIWADKVEATQQEHEDSGRADVIRREHEKRDATFSRFKTQMRNAPHPRNLEYKFHNETRHGEDDMHEVSVHHDGQEVGHVRWANDNHYGRDRHYMTDDYACENCGDTFDGYVTNEDDESVCPHCEEEGTVYENHDGGGPGYFPGEIGYIHVTPAYQRHGIGTGLVQAARDAYESGKASTHAEHSNNKTAEGRAWHQRMVEKDPKMASLLQHFASLNMESDPAFGITGSPLREKDTDVVGEIIEPDLFVKRSPVSSLKTNAFADAEVGLTAHDFIQHEKNVLGNNGIVIEPTVDLHTIPIQYLHWVNKPNHDEDYFGHFDFNRPDVVAHDGDRYLVNSMPSKTASSNDSGEDKPWNNDEEKSEFFKRLRDSRIPEAEEWEKNQRKVVDTSKHEDMKQHMIDSHGWLADDGDFSTHTHWGHEVLGGLPEGGHDGEPDRELNHDELNRMHDWEHKEYQADWPNTVNLDTSHFHTAKANAPVYDFGSIKIYPSKIGGYVLLTKQGERNVVEALAVVEESVKRVFLTSLKVNDADQGLGHGSAMVRAAANLPERLGFRDANQYSMSIVDSLDSALPFYEKMGAIIKTLKSSSVNDDIPAIVYWTPELRLAMASDVRNFKVANPMSGNGQADSDEAKAARNKNREMKKCKTCDGDIYKVNDGSIYPWQHDIVVGSGLPHQAVPYADGEEPQERETGVCTTCGLDIFKVQQGTLYGWQHDITSGAGLPHQAIPDASSVKTAANKPVKDMTPKELDVYRKDEDRKNRAGRSWLRKNPATINNVVDHWDKATDDEKKAGMTWYEDAAHAAKVVGDATGVGHSTMAGLIANYSPQAPWHQNLMYAIRSATEGKGIGGKGSGVMATASRADHADKILSGKHWKDVLGANPKATFALKTRVFASLIEHGGDHDESNPQVCIDRHALSVVHGARLTDRAYNMSGISGKGRYAEYNTQYVKAAKKISKQVGYKVHPHQVQAATWLARQRMNEEEDRANGKESNSAKQAARAKEHYDNYMGENHPELIIPEPGTGYSKRDIGQLPEDVKAAYDLKQEFYGPDSLGSEPKTGSLSVDLRSAFFNFFGE